MAKSVLSREEAEKVAVAYSPRAFPATISPIAVEFVQYQSQEENPSFRIDRLVAQQTGVAEIERLSIEEKVEQEALARLKDLQEEAYQQAYQLGLDEGRDQAFKQHEAELLERMSRLDQLTHSLANLKPDLVAFNESHLVRLAFYIARRIAMTEISTKPETILQVMNEAIASAQTEENVTIRISPDDYRFIESIKETIGKDLEAIRKAKIEESPEITSGGCIVATNYGDVDARVEQRIEKLWESLSEKLPKVKDEAGSGE